jgi:tRNA(adenine34) deaminase
LFQPQINELGCRLSRGKAVLDHEFFMSLALAEAEKAYRRGEVPVGALLTDAHGNVLARGFNSPVAMNDPTAHAEVVVIREAARLQKNYRLPGAVLYVTLEPCAMCLGAMVHARIGVLVFGCSDVKAGTLGGASDLTKLPIFNHYMKTIGGVLADDCSDLLRKFFQERRLVAGSASAGEVPKRP